MRLLRLGLDRYGHVSGERLDFPVDRGLHVVVGANEAGKSTALEALADGLFGFGKDSRRYQHPDDPQVGFTLRTADGVQASFVRRRLGREKLTDGDGAPVPEAALARFLGGTSRKRFRDMFGLNGERLREGGRTIMTEHGEAGAAVLQAQTGLRGLRDTVARLDEEAKALFGTAHAVRRIHKAAATVKENRQLITERSLSATRFVATLAEEAEASARLDGTQAEAAQLRALQARLDRIRRTTPVRAAIAEAARRHQALGPVPDLPADAAPRRLAALEALHQAERDLAATDARRADAQAKLDALTPDPAVLAEAVTIKALGADRSRIAGIATDRLGVEATAAMHRQALDDTAAQLGIAESGAALRARLPDAVTRRTADRLLKERTLRIGMRTQAADTARDSEAALRQAERALADLPEPGHDDALQAAIGAADRAGPIDTDLAATAATLAAAAAHRASAQAGLPLWTGDLARLQDSPVPLDAEALRLGTALDDAAAGHAAAQAALATHDLKLDECRAAIAGLREAGPLPTSDAIAASRARRDDTWRSLRRHVVDGAPLPDGVSAAALSDQFDRHLREADDLADRRTSEAIRVREWEALQAQKGRLLALRGALVGAVDVATADLDEARVAWTAAWAPAGVAPLGPAAMREWVQARERVLDSARDERQACREHDALFRRHATLSDSLRAALPGTEPCFTATEDVAALRQRAGQHLQRHATATAAWNTAVENRTRDTAQHAANEARLAAIDAKAAPWAEAWAPVAAQLGLPPAAEPDAAVDALALWTSAQAQLESWAAAHQRVQQMHDALDQDAARQQAVARRLGLPVTADLVPTLAARLAAAQTDEADARRLETELAELATALGRHRQAHAAAEAELAGLRQLAAVDDDAALAQAIERAVTHEHLAGILRDRTAELHQLDDGKTGAELAAEAATIEIDAIPGRLAEIATQLSDLGREREEVAARRADLKTALRHMEAGQDVTGPAHAVQDALADVEDCAHQYVRVRLAHALLQAGIERFRRSQQGPLLAAASGLFAELTDARYKRLEQDEGDKGEPVIVAVRTDGSACPAEHLSEGTRDQLFLALRLASIRLEAAVSEPLPFIADDLLVHFDDNRAAAALRLLARFGQDTQVILFTHHVHLAELANQAGASSHRLPRELAAA